MHKDFPRHFIHITDLEKTFDLESWVDESGFPKIYENGIITSTKDVSILQIPQSMFMGRDTLHMGIDDLRKSIFGEVSLSYNYTKNQLCIDYHVSSSSSTRAYGVDPVYMDCMVVDLYNEEEYFQQSTVQDLPFTFEEQNMMKVFFDEIRKSVLLTNESGRYAT